MTSDAKKYEHTYNSMKQNSVTCNNVAQTYSEKKSLTQYLNSPAYDTNIEFTEDNF